jgi:hypothetical protein
MNYRLLIDLLISNFNAKKFPNLRSNISLPHGIGERINDVNNIKEKFNQCLKNSAIDQSKIEILQSNSARSRIVAKYRSEKGKSSVIKYKDESSLGTFNFCGSMDMEIELHKMGCKINKNLIPKYITHGENYIIVDFFNGEPLYKYMKKGSELDLYNASNLLTQELYVLYVNTKSGVGSSSVFNKYMHRNYTYMVSTRGGLKLKNFITSVVTPCNVQERFRENSNRAFYILSKIACNLNLCYTIRDLDEHNILYNASENKIRAVDMEDAEISHPVFDLSYYLSRVCLSDAPLLVYEIVNPLIKNLIKEIDSKNSNQINCLLSILTANLLIASAMNPWHWPSNSTFELKDQNLITINKWLKDIWELIDILSE